MARAVLGTHARTSNTAPSGVPQGTMGGKGKRHAVGSRPGTRQLVIGDEKYLWILVLLEAGTLVWLRKQFRRYHGG